MTPTPKQYRITSGTVTVRIAEPFMLWADCEESAWEEAIGIICDGAGEVVNEDITLEEIAE